MNQDPFSRISESWLVLHQGSTKTILAASIAMPNVAIPNTKAIPKWTAIATASMIGLVIRGQIKAAYDNSQNSVAVVIAAMAIG